MNALRSKENRAIINRLLEVLDRPRTVARIRRPDWLMTKTQLWNRLTKAIARQLGCYVDGIDQGIKLRDKEFETLSLITEAARIAGSEFPYSVAALLRGLVERNTPQAVEALILTSPVRETACSIGGELDPECASGVMSNTIGLAASHPQAALQAVASIISFGLERVNKLTAVTVLGIVDQLAALECDITEVVGSTDAQTWIRVTAKKLGVVELLELRMVPLSGLN